MIFFTKNIDSSTFKLKSGYGINQGIYNSDNNRLSFEVDESREWWGVASSKVNSILYFLTAANRNSRNTQDDLHDELKLRMSMGKQAGMGKGKTRPAAMSITQYSTPSDIHDWLVAKHFSAWLVELI